MDRNEVDCEAAPFIEKALPRHLGKKRNLLYDAIPWALVAVLSFWILLTSPLFTSQSSQTRSSASSDFVSAESAIKLTTTKFTSSLEFSDPDHIYRVFDPSEPIYVGNTTSDIDRNWNELILPADIYITDDEAQTLPADAELYRNPNNGKFKIELQVFHSLHCLDMIRRRVYAEHYPEMLTKNARVHVDHCIEALRELLICEGNMTPLPIEWSEQGHRINPNYAQRHTCRDFEALKAWTKERAAKPLQ